MINYDKEPITINDVAAEARVSITTVSRVFNNNYPVKKRNKGEGRKGNRKA